MSLPPNPPLIEIEGSPRDRGRQYGEQAAQRIKLGIEHYATQLDRSKLTWQDIRDITGKYEPTIAAFDADYIEEMRGIAEGAGVEYAAVLLLNARTELLKLAQRRQRGESMPDEDPDGCTGVVVMPKASASGRLIHAQNWDWKAECAETAVILKVRRDNGPDLITFTEAGVLARFGFNSVGISITGNYLECERDYRQFGVPLALIRRKVLEQTQLAVAMKAVYATIKSASNNIIVAHANGVAIDFECAPDETFQVLPERGLIVHANHFQSPVALTKLLDKGIANMPDSLYRDIRVRDLLEPHVGAITPDTVKDALFDDFEDPFSVCRPPRPSLSGNNQSATVAMIVMEPDSGTMDVAMLPALNRTFSRYDLEMEITRPNSTPVSRQAAE
ncbi:MAG TPA: C45 family peptidase [Sphingobium sp.]|nr:C45 family peptidase [Sphingobium sp.]